MQKVVASLLLAAFCVNVCFGVSIPEISPDIDSRANEILQPLPENSTALNAANAKLTELKNLNYIFIHAVLNEFSQIKLPLDFVRDLGNALSLLNLSQNDLVPLFPFYSYETSVYGRFNELRDKMNVFDRQMDYFPYHHLPAAQMDKVNYLLDDVLYKTKVHIGVLQSIVFGPEYQKLSQILKVSGKELQTEVTNLMNMVGKGDASLSDANIESIKNTIIPDIGQIGIKMILTIAAAKDSDWGSKIFESYDAIVNIQKDLPTKLEFSFISV